MSIEVNNYPTLTTTQPGVVEVKGGQLGLFEYGTSSAGPNASTPLWTLFANKPTYYFINPDPNTATMTISLPAQSLSNYADAHPGFIAFIYNTGSTQSIQITDASANNLKLIPPGKYTEFIAYEPGSPDVWYITVDSTSSGGSETLQQAYNLSTPATIEINTTNGALTVYNDTAKHAQAILQVEGNTGGAPSVNFLTVSNTNTGANDPAITGLGASLPTTGAIRSLALGNGATANVINGFALGDGASASANFSMAFGLETSTSGLVGVSIGAQITNSLANTTVLSDGSLGFNPTGTTNEFMLSYQNGLELVGLSTVNGGYTNFASATPSNSPTLRIVQAQQTTTDASTTTIYTYVMQSNSMTSISGVLVGARTGGVGSAGDSYYFDFKAKAKNIAGTAYISTLQKDAAFLDGGFNPNNLTVIASSANIDINIIGLAGSNITWNLNLILNELQF